MVDDMAVKTLSELINNLQKVVDSVLEKEVTDSVRKQMLKAIDVEVYKSYSPTSYERRGVNGGLKDPDNIIGVLDGHGKISIYNATLPNKSAIYGTPTYQNDTDLSRWIEYGLVPNPFNYNVYSWMLPRPFMKTTIEMLAQNKNHVKALKQGLKKRKIKVL